MAVMCFWQLAYVLTLAMAGFPCYLAAEGTPYNFTIRIDCGGSSNFTNEFNQTWIADQFYTGGIKVQLPDQQKFKFSQEKTLRSFPITGGKKNCYEVGVPNGVYYVRMFFVYDNYDNETHAPSFDVSIEGTVVFSWGSEAWTEDNIKFGAYSDVFTPIEDSVATICFYSIGTDSPLVGALELVQVDPNCYNKVLHENILLVNYGRFTGGSSSFGAGMSKETDITGRAWDTDLDFTQSAANRVVLTTDQGIKNANRAPNYFPMYLYQRAHTLSYEDTLEFLLPIDPKLDYMLWFHFAEIDPKISASRQRVFDIVVSGKIVFHNVDIYKEVGNYAVYDLQFTARNLTNATLSVKLVPHTGAPLISGLENYALLPKEVPTDPIDVKAMRAIKRSLLIPERMGWNGDPCAPQNWDAWEGVTCNHGESKEILILTHLVLSNQGLQGSIDSEITGLKHLLSLNLSNNLIKGGIPEGLGKGLLRVVDLSFNQLSGPIPRSLSSSNLRTVLLNGNRLSGEVSEALYSIGVTGGYVNLSDNDALCGVPSLPACSLLWEGSHMSIGSKVAIAFGVIAGVALTLVAAYIIIKRKNSEDYKFGLPHKLASSGRGTRYNRQKSRPKYEGDSSPYVRNIFNRLGGRDHSI
ncbi:hypothetical protein KP509_10G040400 [Ceratopteris richardii]|uniref:Malectin-like domain-containing protein n=1 Tax=Ceratopteris richardii TaxID=49495 RepID=A0A8T2TYI6_CERRI|nr:hypothetical protein KP509_10G040400 [Ceratopteris richardii]